MPEDTQNWLLVYFGGDSKIVETVEVGRTATQALKLMQVSDCQTDYFCKILGTDYVSGESHMLLTYYNTEKTPFTITAPDKDSFPLADSDSCTFSWNSETDTNATGYCCTFSDKN